MIPQTITKTHCEMVYFKFKAMLFCLWKVFFLPGNYTNTLPAQDGKPDPPVGKIAIK